MGSSRDEPLSFNDFDPGIDGDIGDDVDAASDPFHLDLINGLMGSQAELESFAKVALVTSSAVDFVNLGEPSGGD
jgi:hypothetical protein